jgi:hypothetical protein
MERKKKRQMGVGEVKFNVEEAMRGSRNVTLLFL